MQQINFIGNLEQDGDTQIVFIIEETKDTFFYFFKINRESVITLFCFNKMST